MPLRSWTFAISATLALCWLIIACGDAAFAAFAGGDGLGIRAAAMAATLQPGALSASDQAPQLLSYMLAHVSPLHLGLNLYALFLLAPALEDEASPAFLTLLAVVAGVIGGAAHLAMAPILGAEERFAILQSAPLLGASGAISGLLGYDLGRRAALLRATPKALRVIGPDAFLAYTLGLFAVVNIAAMWLFPLLSAPAHIGGAAAGAGVAALVLRRAAPRGDATATAPTR
ncbi:MAG: rhomboid family intramembrane serine protease [Pseudomonadota bacterium]